jgi:tRNA pseudouridine38-40 synthase
MNDRPPKRIAFTVHYDGSSFFGWQLQREERTVQGEIERVLSRLLARPARIIGSGRTDRGVHATGQVASVDVPDRWGPGELRRAMNALLPRDIWIADAAEVAGDFHPRYGALSRSYVYRVGISEGSGSPFAAPWCWPLRRPLDLELAGSAARLLVGDHSFRAFAKAGQAERGDRCVVEHASWARWAELGVEFRITANRFLHHMVRYLVGTMVEIALGKRVLNDLQALLANRSEVETSPPAPPGGLFLTAVRYPEGAYAPAAAERWLRGPGGVAGS